MAKADLPIPNNPLAFQVIGGVDESKEDARPSFSLATVSGVFPYFTGSLNRLFGKKLIDANPGQSVMAIAQAFNGFGQFGYYVQTTFKLYYHLCETPADLFIKYVLKTTLGVDVNNKTLNIFGQGQDGAIPKDTVIPCVFDFPDKPVPPPTTFLFDTEFNNYSSTITGQDVRLGMVAWRVVSGTGTTIDPCILEEAGRWYEGVDFPVPDFSTPFLLNISPQLLFYTGSQKFMFTIWYQNVAGTRVTYQCPLAQVLKVGDVGVTNFSSKKVTYPTNPLNYFNDATIGGVAMVDTAAAHGTFRFPINS